MRDIFNVKLGVEFDLKILGSNPLSENFPGDYILEKYDKDYLKITNCSWFYLDNSTTNPVPCLNISFLPLALGKTQVRGLVQDSKFNPVFKQYTYDIVIS